MLCCAGVLSSDGSPVCHRNQLAFHAPRLQDMAFFYATLNLYDEAVICCKDRLPTRASISPCSLARVLGATLPVQARMLSRHTSSRLRH